jgi:hypothetical protein
MAEHVCDPLLPPKGSGGAVTIARGLRLLLAYLDAGWNSSVTPNPGAGNPRLAGDLETLLAEFGGCPRCVSAGLVWSTGIAADFVRMTADAQGITVAEVIANLDAQLAAALDEIDESDDEP